MRVLAIDHCAARCGCAISDPSGTIATPLEALPPDKRGDTLAMKARVLTLEEVQMHAMLATVHDDAYSEYLDLKSMEDMRERVGRDARRDVT